MPDQYQKNWVSKTIKTPPNVKNTKKSSKTGGLWTFSMRIFLQIIEYTSIPIIGTSTCIAMNFSVSVKKIKF